MKNDKLHCFLIDDDPDDLDFFEIALETSGIPYILSKAENAIKAMEIINDIKPVPDYIFLDLNMPLLSGIECLRLIKENPLLSSIPVIIFTTSSYHKDIEDAKSLGATHFLTKTPNIQHLSNILNDILTSKELSFILN